MYYLVTRNQKGCAKIKHFLLLYYLKDLNLILYTEDAYMKYNEKQLHMEYYSSINSVSWEQFLVMKQTFLEASICT
jgi:helix-turn-helix protein